MGSFQIQSYITEFKERIIEGDIFDHTNIVVPIKTGGRVYGAISKQFIQKYPTVELPILLLSEAITVPYKDRCFTFVGYWNDESEYTPHHIATCAQSAIRSASNTCDDRGTLTIPLFRGIETELDMGIIGEAIVDIEGIMLACGQIPMTTQVIVRSLADIPG